MVKETTLWENKESRVIRLDDLKEKDYRKFSKIDRAVNLPYYLEKLEENPNKWIIATRLKFQDDLYHRVSVRPYEEGEGCDGTNTANILHIAKILCDRAELDYFKIYRNAYGRRKDKPDTTGLTEMVIRPDVIVGTSVPDNINIHQLNISLRDANCHDFVDWLKSSIEDKFHVGKQTYNMKDGKYTGTFFQSDLKL